MDLKNTGKYECRSLLNYFSGGTVYDTSVKYSSPAYNKSVLKNPMNTKIQIRMKNKSLIDSITHLDDDVFNDYIEHSNVNYQQNINNNNNNNNNNNDNAISNFSKTEKLIGFECYSSQSTQDYAPNFVDSVMDNSNNYIAQDSSNLSGSVCYFNNLNRNTENNSFLVETDTTEEEIYSQFSSLINTSDSNTSSDIRWQESNESSFSSLSATGFTSTSRLTHKRKQTYIIRDDLFLEMPNEDYEVLNKITLSSKCKKRKPIRNKENKKEALYKNEKPFGQVKMSSILKNRKASYANSSNVNSYNPENKIISNERNIFTSCSDNFSINNNNSINENTENKKNSFVFMPFNALQISTEFTQPNYFDYVQPIEKIGYDLDKLISPTIEMDIPQVIETPQVQHLQEEDIDCNGNKIGSQNVQNKEVQSLFSQNELCIEKIIFSRTTLAKKLGFKNVFNTSNDSVMNEIFFDEAPVYKKIKLDASWQGNQIITESCQFVNKSFKPVSLMESLNELKRFGGFTEESDKGKSNGNEEDSPLIIDDSLKSPGYSRQEDKLSQSDSSFTLHSLNDSNSIDDNLSEETITCSETETQKSSTSIKIKIKRIINDKKNEYVIDDSVKSGMNIKEAKTVNKVSKDIERYECADCLDKFRTKKLLKSHVSAYHKGPYDIECDICHMKFKKSSARKPHLPWCEKNKKFKCNLCSKEYCYNASLKKHLKTHLNFSYSELSLKEEPKDPLA